MQNYIRVYKQICYAFTWTIWRLTCILILYFISYFFHHVEFQKSEFLHNLNGNGIRLSQQKGLDLNLVLSGLNRNFHVPSKILKKGIGRLTPYSDMSGKYIHAFLTFQFYVLRLLVQKHCGLCLEINPKPKYFVKMHLHARKLIKIGCVNLHINIYIGSEGGVNLHMV